MAQDMNTRSFEDMSNDELVEYVGGNVSPDASRNELLIMAMETERSRKMQR